MKRRWTIEDVFIRLSDGLGALDLIWVAIALAIIILTVLWVA